jgi:hypothetical protein
MPVIGGINYTLAVADRVTWMSDQEVQYSINSREYLLKKNRPLSSESSLYLDLLYMEQARRSLEKDYEVEYQP